MRKVFLEKNELTQEFIIPCIYDAWVGFTNLGYKCESFYYKQMESLDLSKETIVFGQI